MAAEENIRRVVRKMVEDMIPLTIQWAKVDSVDEDNGLMTAIGLEDGLPFEDVLLSISSSGLTIIPEKDSKVLIGMVENSDMNAMLLMSEQIKSCLITTLENGFKLHLKDDGTMSMNGDTLGGLIKIDDLVSKLNNLENSVNQLKTEFNVHTHSSSSGPTGLPITASTVNLNPTAKSELENTKIKHG